MSRYKDLLFLTKDRMIDHISGDPMTPLPLKNSSTKPFARIASKYSKHDTEFKSIHESREVNGFYSLVPIQPLLEPFLAVISKPACDTIRLDYNSLNLDTDHLDLLAGISTHKGQLRYALNYAGHQYGVYIILSKGIHPTTGWRTQFICGRICNT